MRPGEKLHESLAASDERLETATCPGLSIVHRRTHFAPTRLQQIIRRLQHIINVGDAAMVVETLCEIVPTFVYDRPEPEERAVKAIPELPVYLPKLSHAQGTQPGVMNAAPPHGRVVCSTESSSQPSPVSSAS